VVWPGAGALTRDDYFAAESAFWREIHTPRDVHSLIRQYRQSLALAWVDELHLPPGSAALDVGCGAGLTTIDLAQRGLQVTAIDHVGAMVELAREEAEAAGVAGRVEASVRDAQSLPFADAGFELVVAMGLIPRLGSPFAALCEIARVLKPDGTLIVSRETESGLNALLDPVWNPWFASLRRLLPTPWRPEAGPSAGMESVAEFDELLWRAGFVKQEGHTFGFGPFAFVGRFVLPRRLGVRVQDWLQRAADRHRSSRQRPGTHYIVLARKA
jgi:SAM-dependent methyltransferase